MIDMKFIFTLLLISSSIILSQKGSILGKILDENNDPVIGVNVLVQNTLLGTATDSRGEFIIRNIPNGSYTLEISVIGYTKLISDPLNVNNNNIKVEYILNPTIYKFDQLVVSAGKHSQEIGDIAASTYIIDQEIFSQRNFQKVDDALRFVPGVTMTDDQLSIRGSSGYSRGAGTRVLVAIDGIPIYTPDAGDIVWELVPITEIGRVEIIKGASSSLYGSSAIGGIVNIISKEISSNPLTYIKFQGGIYSNPSHYEWKWTDRTLTFNSQTISHSRSIGKLSLSGSFTRFEDYSYRQNNFQLRFAGFLKAKYQFSESTTLSLLGTGYTRDRKTFNYWRDISKALSPPEADLGQSTNSDRTILGFTFDHIFSDDFYISFIPSTYFSYWKDDSEANNKSNSKIYRTELRTNYKYSKSLFFISGVEFQYSQVESNIFGDRDANGIGIYSQADIKPVNKLNVSFGLRYDLNYLAELEKSQSLSPKFGITYQLDSQTILRSQIAKGFRSPTLAEAFSSTVNSGLTIKPNPNIKPETSYSIEIGANHSFSSNLNLDISLFNNEYYDMIEPGIDPKDGEAFFNNVTRARIQGFELSSNFNLLDHFEANIGYTYIWARDIEKKKALNYRPRYSVILGFGYNLDNYELGVDFRYLSRVESIDKELIDLGVIPDGDNRVDIYVLDAHAGISLFNYQIPAKIFFNVNNWLNYNYVELIGNIAPLRNYSINFEFVF
jgi:iron complex outermembrane receptor protein